MEEDVDPRDADGVDGRGMGGGFTGGMVGCVVWVRCVSHRYLGWYVGPGLSVRYFRLVL